MIDDRDTRAVAGVWRMLGCACPLAVPFLSVSSVQGRMQGEEEEESIDRDYTNRFPIYSIQTPHRMADLTSRPKSELTQSELQDLEDYEFLHGPLRVLAQAVQNSDSVLISLRNGHKLVAKVKAFDKHCNMVLENVKEFWYEDAKTTSNSATKVLRERFVSKMFLRGDSVVVVLKYTAE